MSLGFLWWNLVGPLYENFGKIEGSKTKANHNFTSHVSPSLKLTAKAPENGWLEDEIPIGKAYFQGRTVSFRRCSCSASWIASHLGDLFEFVFLWKTAWKTSSMTNDFMQLEVYERAQCLCNISTSLLPAKISNEKSQLHIKTPSFQVSFM